MSKKNILKEQECKFDGNEFVQDECPNGTPHPKFPNLVWNNSVFKDIWIPARGYKWKNEKEAMEHLEDFMFADVPDLQGKLLKVEPSGEASKPDKSEEKIDEETKKINAVIETSAKFNSFDDFNLAKKEAEKLNLKSRDELIELAKKFKKEAEDSAEAIPDSQKALLRSLDNYFIATTDNYVLINHVHGGFFLIVEEPYVRYALIGDKWSKVELYENGGPLHTVDKSLEVTVGPLLPEETPEEEGSDVEMYAGEFKKDWFRSKKGKQHPSIRINSKANILIYAEEDPLGIQKKQTFDLNEIVNRLFGYTGGWAEYKKENLEDLTRPVTIKRADAENPKDYDYREKPQDAELEKGDKIIAAPTLHPFHVAFAYKEYAESEGKLHFKQEGDDTPEYASMLFQYSDQHIEKLKKLRDLGFVSDFAMKTMDNSVVGQKIKKRWATAFAPITNPFGTSTTQTEGASALGLAINSPRSTISKKGLKLVQKISGEVGNQWFRPSSDYDVVVRDSDGLPLLYDKDKGFNIKEGEAHTIPLIGPTGPVAWTRLEETIKIPEERFDFSVTPTDVLSIPGQIAAYIASELGIDKTLGIDEILNHELISGTIKLSDKKEFIIDYGVICTFAHPKYVKGSYKTNNILSRREEILFKRLGVNPNAGAVYNTENGKIEPPPVMVGGVPRNLTKKDKRVIELAKIANLPKSWVAGMVSRESGGNTAARAFNRNKITKKLLNKYGELGAWESLTNIPGLKPVTVKTEEGRIYQKLGSSPKTGDHYNEPNSLFQKAFKLAPKTAIHVTAWGTGQVMGFNFKKLWQDNPQAFYDSWFNEDGKGDAEGARKISLKIFKIWVDSYDRKENFRKKVQKALRTNKISDWYNTAALYYGVGKAKAFKPATKVTPPGTPNEVETETGKEIRDKRGFLIAEKGVKGAWFEDTEGEFGQAGKKYWKATFLYAKGIRGGSDRWNKRVKRAGKTPAAGDKKRENKVLIFGHSQAGRGGYGGAMAGVLKAAGLKVKRIAYGGFKDPALAAKLAERDDLGTYSHAVLMIGGNDTKNHYARAQRQMIDLLISEGMKKENIYVSTPPINTARVQKGVTSAKRDSNRRARDEKTRALARSIGVNVIPTIETGSPDEWKRSRAHGPGMDFHIKETSITALDASKKIARKITGSKEQIATIDESRMLSYINTMISEVMRGNMS